MTSKQKPDSINGVLVLPLVLLNTIVIKHSYTENGKWWWLLILTLPLLLLVIKNNRKKKRPVVHDHPAIGRVRYFFETGPHKKTTNQAHRSQYIRFKVFSKGR